MPKRIWKDHSLLRFLAVAFVLGMGLQTLYFYDPKTRWLIFAMWAPAIAVLCLGKKGLVMLSNLRRFEPSWILLGAALGILPNLISQAIYGSFGLGIWDQEHWVLSLDGTMVEKIEGYRLIFGSGPQEFFFLALNLLISFSIAGTITTFAGALGEEIGWRGFLQPNLNNKYGVVVATVITGLLWAYWHIPVNLTGYNGGGQNLWLVTFVTFPISVLFISSILTWLRLRSHAIWPCAFMHGFYNVTSNFHLWKPRSAEIEIAVNLASLGVVAAVFIWLLARYQYRLPHPSGVHALHSASSV